MSNYRPSNPCDPEPDRDQILGPPQKTPPPDPIPDPTPTPE
jgi:hypothetical protein